MKKNKPKNPSPLEFDQKQHRFVFREDCLKMHPLCQVQCCIHNMVNISRDEFDSGQYEAEVVCQWTDKACHFAPETCLYLRFQLKKRADRSCVYLEGNCCSIYEKRPRVCRDFVCRGIYLDWSKPARKGRSDKNPNTQTREMFLKRLNEDLTFVLHPLLKVHTVVYQKSKREIIFVKEMVGGCGKFNTRDRFDYLQLDNAQLMMLIELFSRKEPLGRVYRLFCSRSSGKLGKRDFFSLVWLLNKHNIIIESRNFRGLLGGIGRLG